MQFLEVQRADIFFFAKSVKKVQLEIHTKWNPTYNHTVITVLISCTYFHSLKSVYYNCSLYYSMQFLKFNEQTQGQTWLDAFFVQSRNRIRKKFNLKAFTYYLRLQKSLLYIFPIEFLSNFTIFESSMRCLKVRPDWIPFLCKIIMKFVENSIWKLLFIFQGVRKSLQVL